MITQIGTKCAWYLNIKTNYVESCICCYNNNVFIKHVAKRNSLIIMLQLHDLTYIVLNNESCPNLKQTLYLAILSQSQSHGLI